MIDDDLKAYLDQRFTSIDNRFTQLGEYIDQRFTEHHEYVDKRTRDMETHILTAFYGFTNTLDARHKSATAAQHGLEDRFSALEARILELERRMNL